MAAPRHKTPAEINIETVNKYIDEFVAKTKHLIDAKLELPFEKSKKPTKKLNVEFTLDKSDEELKEACYASHATSAIHFVLSCVKAKKLYDERDLIENHLHFLKAFRVDKAKISHDYSLRIVDAQSRLLAGAFLDLLKEVKKLPNPFDGILPWLLRKIINKKKFIVRVEMIIKGLDGDIAYWDQFNKSTFSVAGVMKELKQLPPAAVAPPPAPPQAVTPPKLPAPLPTPSAPTESVRKITR